MPTASPQRCTNGHLRSRPRYSRYHRAAGKAAHLGGVVAAYTPLPVIAVPMKTSDLGGLDSLLSMVQMPSGVPVATVAINGAKNAGILAVQMLGTGNDEAQCQDRKAQSRYGRGVKGYSLMAKEFLTGNEAFAHAALEAGVRVCAGYPGTPSSEVIETVAKEHAAGSRPKAFMLSGPRTKRRLWNCWQVRPILARAHCIPANRWA